MSQPLAPGFETGTGMDRIFQVLIGNPSAVGDAVLKTAALFITAATLFRFTERRTLAEFAPFDWIAAVAAGAIVGRAATATDTSWLGATAALRRNLRQCGLTDADLQAVLREHGHRSPESVQLAIFEAKSAISVLRTNGQSGSA